MSINPYLITKIWYCTICTHHLDKHEGKCIISMCDCKEFYVEAMTENNHLIRGKTLDKWYFYYEHGYIIRYHHKATNTWESNFHRYSDELIKHNRRYL